MKDSHQPEATPRNSTKRVVLHGTPNPPPTFLLPQPPRLSALHAMRSSPRVNLSLLKKKKGIRPSSTSYSLWKCAKTSPCCFRHNI